MSLFNSAIPARKASFIILGSLLLTLLWCPPAESQTQTEVKDPIKFPRRDA